MVNWSHCRKTQGGKKFPTANWKIRKQHQMFCSINCGFVVCVLAVCVGPTSRTLSLMVPSPSWSKAWNAPAGRGERERKGPSTVFRGAGMDDTTQHNIVGKRSNFQVFVLLPGLFWSSFSHQRAVCLALCLLPPAKTHHSPTMGALCDITRG